MSHNNVAKEVSFTKNSRIIGQGSYEIEPDVKLKHVKNRPPTPTDSLTSIGKQPYVEKLANGTTAHEEDEEDDDNYEFIGDISVNAKIFVEHLFIRFKRKIVNGVGTMVLDCLCHYKMTEELLNKIDFLSEFFWKC